MTALCRLLASIARALVILFLAGMSVSGCKTSTQVVPSTLENPLCPALPDYPAVEKPVAEGLAAALAAQTQAHPATSQPLQVLALSGGVLGAPYAAGVLVGWTESGKRPTFDVVTGVSSGALIGAYAFLGPKYDANLQRVILTLKTSALIKFQPGYGLLHDGALASTNPAKRLIQTEINNGFLADLRQAHAEGRRFFVGTMSLQTMRPVIWDVGAIASSGRPDADDLVRKVLLAALSFPGLVPPVEFHLEVNGRCYEEEQCDAGSVAMAFVRFGSLPGWPERGAPAQPGWLADSNLYVLACRRLYSDPAPVPKRMLSRTMTSINAALEANARAEIDRLYSVCAASGMRFHLLAVPREYHGKPLTMKDLYPSDAPQLFEMGHQMGASGPPWRLTPPGAEPGEEAIPWDGSNIAICPRKG